MTASVDSKRQLMKTYSVLPRQCSDTNRNRKTFVLKNVNISTENNFGNIISCSPHWNPT